VNTSKTSSSPNLPKPPAPKPSASRPLVVGTAGHIDHGKSLLVRALTGIDPDRLKEERERGITIDLGFAHLPLPDGTTVGFVDVPGHERFVRNMLAGVGGIDLVMLIIAADESIKPQTREHFDICRLLRIPRGLVVLTKSDLVDADLLEVVREEAQAFVAGSFLEGAPIVPVSARTGAGLDALREALQAAAREIPARDAAGLARLPIDRAFSMKGFGAVVTGTLVAGTLEEGQAAEILPQRLQARIRGLQVHGRATRRAAAGQRLAVNLHGVELADLERGQTLSEPGVLEPTRVLDVVLEHLPGAAPLRDQARLSLHLQTAEVPCRVRLLEGAVLQPGARAYAQIRSARPVTAVLGDRFILRRPSPALTVAGGTVLHNAPRSGRLKRSDRLARGRRLDDPSPLVPLVALVEDGGDAGVDVPALRSRTGLDAATLQSRLESREAAASILALPTTPRRYVSRTAADRLAREVLDAAKEFHRREPLREGLAREEVRTKLFRLSHDDVFRAVLNGLVSQAKLRTDKDRIALATHQVSLAPAEAAILDRLEASYRTGGANPPEKEEAAKGTGADPRTTDRLIHLLLSRGRLVRIPDGKIFHVEAIQALKERLWQRRAQGDSIDIGEFKDLSGTSRKNAIPLLEYFDQTLTTRREGNRRVILPPPASAAPPGKPRGD
jgi:selenocysteine-specific elongation factor